MDNKKLYQQRVQAQLDEWQAEIDRLRAKAASASAERRLEMNRQIEDLESKLAEGKAKVAELNEAGDDAWESIKDGIEDAWGTLKTSFDEAAATFQR